MDGDAVPGDACHSYRARLVVHDWLGEPSERTVTSRRCSDAARSAALLVAIALDAAERAPEDPPGPAPAEPVASSGLAFWPAPVADEAEDAARKRRRGRQGSGGLVATGIAGAGYLGESMFVRGARVYGAARVGPSTRVGLSVAFASETERTVIANGTLYESNGWSGRAGAIIGWGAPWNDSIVGFLGEAGVAARQQSGSQSPERGCAALATSSEESLSGWGGTRCFDVARSSPSSIRSFGPSAAATLVLQIPWKAPIRPVAGFTTAAVYGGAPMSGVTLTADFGFVWQAW